jgi:hypothetical protein
MRSQVFKLLGAPRDNARFEWETTSWIFGHFFPGDRDALWRLADFETIFPLS